jgi:hypothetical protein
MVYQHLDEITKVDVMTLDQGGNTRIKYSKELDLDQYEKVH